MMKFSVALSEMWKNKDNEVSFYKDILNDCFLFWGYGLSTFSVSEFPGFFFFFNIKR